MDKPVNISFSQHPTWANADIQNFWGKIASCDHLVQIYENEKVFINTLEGFVGDGFLREEAVIIIASDLHLSILEDRLIDQGFDLPKLRATNQFITMRIEDATRAFMVNGWPDETLFYRFVSALKDRALQNSNKLRVFGEIVADLWEKGMYEATLHLENLWHRLQHREKFCLLCAYPKGGFTREVNESIRQICNTHSKVIDGNSRPSTEIYYQDAQQQSQVSPR